MSNKTKYHAVICDSCGNSVMELPCILVADLPRDITMRKKGQNAILCFPCEDQIYGWSKRSSHDV